MTSSNSNSLNNLLSSRPILSHSSDYSSQEHVKNVSKMIYQSQDWSRIVTDWDPTFHDTSWLLSHVSDMVQYRPSLKELCCHKYYEYFLNIPVAKGRGNIFFISTIVLRTLFENMYVSPFKCPKQFFRNVLFLFFSSKIRRMSVATLERITQKRKSLKVCSYNPA